MKSRQQNVLGFYNSLLRARQKTRISHGDSLNFLYWSGICLAKASTAWSSKPPHLTQESFEVKEPDRSSLHSTSEDLSRIVTDSSHIFNPTTDPRYPLLSLRSQLMWFTSHLLCASPMHRLLPWPTWHAVTHEGLVTLLCAQILRSKWAVPHV